MNLAVFFFFFGSDQAIKAFNWTGDGDLARQTE